MGLEVCRSSVASLHAAVVGEGAWVVTASTIDISSDPTEEALVEGRTEGLLAVTSSGWLEVGSSGMVVEAGVMVSSELSGSSEGKTTSIIATAGVCASSCGELVEELGSTEGTEVDVGSLEMWSAAVVSRQKVISL